MKYFIEKLPFLGKYRYTHYIKYSKLERKTFSNYPYIEYSDIGNNG